MNVQDLPRRINANDELVVCFDVSKEKLDGYAIHPRTGAPDREITVTIERRTDQIEEQLGELSSYADEHGLDSLCVVCEPTGGYDQELLRLARKQGHRTAYVNTEHSAKMSTIESGDTNKTDPVDRTQAHRTLEDEYGLLRELGQMYERVGSDVRRRGRAGRAGPDAFPSRAEELVL
jgi:transposase